MNDLTERQNTMLQITFNSEDVRSMDPTEYSDYLQTLLTLTLCTTKKTHGVQFCKDFVEAALNDNGDQVVVQQFKGH